MRRLGGRCVVARQRATAAAPLPMPCITARYASSSSSASNNKSSGASGTPRSATHPAASAARTARAEAIRRREMLLRWLRRLVVPAFSLYGLFLLRPTEGHFLRYVAERRHLEPDFNAWFPPVTIDAAAHAATSSSASPQGAAAHGTGGGASAAAFRNERDRDWAAQRFQFKKGSEDEERVARRRLLFARDREYLADDTVVEKIRSPAEQLEELRALREHPPMHLLSEQLNSIAAQSHRYAAEKANADASTEAAPRSPPAPATPPPPPPPQVELEFEDHTLFATAAIRFHDRDGRLVRTMRFVGACGLMWKGIA